MCILLLMDTGLINSQHFTLISLLPAADVKNEDPNIPHYSQVYCKYFHKTRELDGHKFQDLKDRMEKSKETGRHLPPSIVRSVPGVKGASTHIGDAENL